MNKKIIILISCLLLGVLSGCGSGQEMIFRQDRDEGENATSGDFSSQQEEWLIYVHVCGAVKEPGVVALQEGSRVFDAVEAAGLTQDADDSYVNLAAVALDGARIYIPTKAEAAAGTSGPGLEGRININTADAALLCTLPGIGEGRAEEIIRYREQNGPFQKQEQLMEVEGIKQSVYEKVKDLITVDG